MPETIPSDAAIDAVLNFDPLDTAEKMLDANGGVRGDAGMLGLLMAIDHNKKKSDLLKSMGDTGFSNELGRYQSIVEALGFELCLQLSFTGKNNWLNEKTGKPYEEQYFIYARRDGLLLSFDTFHEDAVNSAHLYYNWEFDPSTEWWKSTSSGGGSRDHKNVWSGHHDAREALKHKISKLEKNGKFRSNWVERPFLWLLHYMDEKDDGASGHNGRHYETVNAQRIAMLPAWVQEMIGTNEG